jgi:hypothetical protein
MIRLRKLAAICAGPQKGRMAEGTVLEILHSNLEFSTTGELRICLCPFAPVRDRKKIKKTKSKLLQEKGESSDDLY